MTDDLCQHRGKTTTSETPNSYQTAFDEEDWRADEAKAALGACLASLGRYGEAESFLRKGYAVLQEKHGEQRRETRMTHKAFFDLYTAWGKPEQAAAYRDQTP